MSPRLFAAFCAVLVAAAAAAATIETSDAATTTRLRVIRKAGDSFRNYDFDSKKVAADNVDWPVDLVFYNNASINGVKDAMGGYMPWSGSAKYGRLKDSASAAAVWDEDKGRKTVWCSNPESPDSVHMRLYAPPERDRMYNRKWGYYIIGTAHIDHLECVPWAKWHGNSERAERSIVRMASDVYGHRRVKYNHRNFENAEFRREGRHHWNNDAMATFIKVGGS